MRRTLEEGADLGVAFDGDADRCFFVDDTGEFVPGDFATALLAESILEKEPGAKVIYDVRASWAVPETIERAGGTPLVNRVGHAFIKLLMRKEEAAFAGEVSGHYYFRDFSQADSGVIPFLLMLELLREAGERLSEILAPFRERYFITGELNTPVADVTSAPAARGALRNRGRVSHLDGVSVDVDGWHLNVRPSNTEPLLRLNLEARSRGAHGTQAGRGSRSSARSRGGNDTLELGRVTDRRPPFKYSALARVWFSDTDAQGIVYYGRYLPYFDHARTEYHRHLLNAPFAQAGGDLVMRALPVEYHAPARFDDLIEAYVRVKRIGRTSMSYECAAYRLPDDVLMVTAELTVVLVDLDEREADPDPGRRARGDPRLRRLGPRGMSDRALEDIGRILEGGGEPDDVLRAAVAVLVEEPGIAWAAIAFLEDRELVVGPRAGEPDEARRARVPVLYQGARVGELWIDGDAEPAFLDHVAALLSAHVLIGWDTRGEHWQP